MKKILLLILILCTAGFLLQCSAYGQNTDSALRITQYVTDETGTLTASQIDELKIILKNFEDSTSNQVVVYIISSLKGKPIEMLAYDLAEKTGIGQKGRNNGVLLLIAMKEKQLRIEVGYGLEGALPDALCGRIIDNEIKPEFRNDNYFEGISKGVQAIMSATKGEYEPSESKKGFGGCFGPTFFVIAIFGFIFISIIIEILKGIFGFGRVYTKAGKKNGWKSGGWFWGGGSGSGSSGGSFGGFSGGGGSFGGGGASGSW